jgi:mannan endo-1,6-alpha-mannosidase
MLSFKGYLHRWLAETAILAPYTADQIMPVLRTSTAAAVAQCTGGTNGRFCGFKWSSGTFDGKTGACQQMSVLAALMSLLQTPEPLTNSTGGSSVGNPNAGTNQTTPAYFAPITTGDRAGAAILTILLLGGTISTFVWMGFGS